MNKEIAIANTTDTLNTLIDNWETVYLMTEDELNYVLKHLFTKVEKKDWLRDIELKIDVLAYVLEVLECEK